MKEKPKRVPTWEIAQNYIDQHFVDKILIDGSKDPETGRTGAAVFIAHCEMAVKKTAADHHSVYPAELLGILLMTNTV